MYRDYSQNDLRKEKSNAIGLIKQIKNESLNYTVEINELASTNLHLKKTIRRY